jgi:alkylated DNA repair dioxygenase AlkB
MFTNLQPLYIHPQDAEIVFVQQFFSEDEANVFFKHLRKETDWQSYTITLYGKEYMQPRLLAWYGEEGKRYAYSGRVYQPYPWNKHLLAIKTKVEDFTRHTFNSCLLNLYRNGQGQHGLA